MKTLDDLTTSLDAYAERDTPRGAAVVWADATEAPPLAAPGVLPPPPRRRPLLLVAAAAACILLVAAFAALRAEHEVDVSTAPDTGSVPGPASSTVSTAVVPAPPASLTGPRLSLIADRPLRDGDFAAVGLAGFPAGTDVTLQACLVSAGPDGACGQRIEPDPPRVIPIVEPAGEGPMVSGWDVRRSIFDVRWHDCGVEACELRAYPVGDDGRIDRSVVLARTPLTFEGSGAIIRPNLRRADGDAIHAGDTVTVLGQELPAGATIRLRFCPTGPQTADCVDDGAEPATVADDGTVELRFTVPSTTLGPDGSIDCESGRGVCMFALFADEQSIETYAATLLDFVPFDVGGPAGTVPGTMPP